MNAFHPIARLVVLPPDTDDNGRNEITVEERRAALPHNHPLTVDLVSFWMKRGKLKQDDVWEIALALWAHAQGYLALWRAGRFHLSEDEFRKLVHRSFRRLLHGLAR